MLFHPSNHGHRLERLGTAVRFEFNALRKRPTTIAFGDHSRIVARKGGDSSNRAVFARLPDWPAMSVWRHFLRRGDVFVDVGANVGLYSLLAAELGCSVHAIEPAADMASALRENIALTGTTSVQVHEVAVLDTARTVDLVGADANRRRAVPSTAGHIRTVTLDELVGSQPVRGMKVDVEGNERLVLDGAPATLSEAHLALVQLEWNHTSSAALGESREPLAARLHAAGFELFQCLPAGGLRAYPDVPPPFGGDVFAARGGAVDLLAAWE